MKSTTRRPGLDVLLAVLLPLACALVLLLLQPDRGQPSGAAPVEAPPEMPST